MGGAISSRVQHPADCYGNGDPDSNPDCYRNRDRHADADANEYTNTADSVTGGSGIRSCDDADVQSGVRERRYRRLHM